MKANQWRPVATRAELARFIGVASDADLWAEGTSIVVNGQRWAGTQYAMIAVEGTGARSADREATVVSYLARSRTYAVSSVEGTTYCGHRERAIIDGRAVDLRALRVAENIFGPLSWRVQPLAEHSAKPAPAIGYLGAIPCVLLSPQRTTFRRVTTWVEVSQ